MPRRVRHETLTEQEFDQKYRQGGRRLAPGFWVDRDGALHVSIPELLALADLPDTPEDRAAVQRIVDDIIVEHLPASCDLVYCDPPPAATPGRPRHPKKPRN